jgi:hypothetical protein
MLMYVYPLRGGAAVQNSRKFVWFKFFRLPFFCCLESIVLNLFLGVQLSLLHIGVIYLFIWPVWQRTYWYDVRNINKQ